MPIVKCHRCAKKTPKINQCSYCNRHICNTCVKSSKRTKRKDVLRISICKDCWGNMEVRSKYRSNTVVFGTSKKAEEKK